MTPPALVQRASTVLRSRYALRALLVTAGAVLLFALLGHFALPSYLRSLAQRELSAALSRPVSIARVAVNPFTLEVTVEGLTIGQRSGVGQLVSVRRIVANVSIASAWRRAPVLDALVIDGLQAALAREADGRYNVQDLLDAYAAAPPGPPPGFSLNNIEVVDSSLVFDDQPMAARHTVDKLNIGVPFLSSLPYDTELRVTPRLAAVVDGRPFLLTGQSQPFAEPPQASIDLDVDALPLPRYLGYLPWPKALKLASGELTSRVKLTFVAGSGNQRALELAGVVQLANVKVDTARDAPLFAVKQASIAVRRADLVGQAVEIAAVEVIDPAIDVRRGADGRFEWGDLAARLAPAAQATPSARWQWRVDRASVNGGVVRIEDGSTKPVFRSTVRDLAAQVERLAATGAPGRVTGSFVTDLGAAVSAEATLGVSPLAVDGRVEGRGLRLDRLFPYYAAFLNLEVADGVLDAGARVVVAQDANGSLGVQVSAGEAGINRLSLHFPGEKEPLWQVGRLAVTGFTMDTVARRVTLGDVSVVGLRGRIRRDPDGSFSFARLVRSEGIPEAGAVADASATAWQVVVDHSATQRATVEFEDRVPATPFRTRLTDLDLAVDGWSNAVGKRAQFDVRARVGATGRASAKGSLAVTPFAGRLDVSVSAIELAPFQPYLDGVVNVVVTGGRATARGTLDIAAPTGGAAAPPAVGWKGNATITDFASLDKPTMSDLARWNKLTLTGIDAVVGPPRFAVAEIAIDRFFARVIVHDDATLNLTRLLTAPAPSAAPRPAAPAVAPAVDPRAELPVTVGRIALTDGTVLFSDFYVKPNYSARLTDVVGSVSAMSATTTGDVEIAARVEQLAPVEIRGRLNPFARDLVLDITGKARDIELSPLSPYAAKYAGYGIEKGKLAFDVNYAIEGRKLAAKNRLVLDQLTFGDKVDSPTATKLPVLLAVSLLKDVNGVIDISLPIEGSLDDPKFSVGGLIVQVIVNLLTKAVTAPFALLSAAFGGGEEMSWLAFAPGSAALDAAAVTKAQALAKALNGRPGLKLDIGGRVDPAADGEGLRRAEVERAIRAQKAKSLAAAGGAAPAIDEVTVDADERVRFLVAAYRTAPIEERPRNVIGMLKDVPPAEMEALLLRHAKADGDALRELGQRRAQAVKDWLVGSGGVAPGRLFLVAGRFEAAPPKDGPAIRVDFVLR